jgi:peptidoglycan/LPS O-acetylase OafA/YrhL
LIDKQARVFISHVELNRFWSPAHKALASVRTSSQLEYRRDIDGLRAVAVLYVVIFHAFPSLLPGGFVGVDIFFVISGFLISGIIFQSLATREFSFTRFYQRRIKRIFPSLIVVLSFSLLLGWIALSPDELLQLGKHVFASATFSNNFVLWKESGYFDNAGLFKPLLHLWSLGIEEQFYLVFPLAVWLTWRWPSVLIAGLVATAALSFGLNVINVNAHAIATYYLPMTRFWQLLAGSVLAYVMLQRNLDSPIPPSFRNIASLGGALLIVASAAFINPREPYPGYWALLPTIGTVILIATGKTAWCNKLILGQPILVFVGLISYPLYLWHWVLLSFGQIIESGAAISVLRAFLIGVSVSSAWLTYELIERPIRFRTAPWGRPVWLGLGLGVIGCAGLGVSLAAGIPSRFSADYLARLQDVTSYSESRLDCPSEIGTTMPKLSFCNLARKGQATAVIWGDSHADRIFASLGRIDRKRNWLLLANVSCPPTINIDVNIDVWEVQQHCEARNRNIVNLISHSNEIKTVLLVFFGNYIATDDYAANHVVRHTGPAEISITTTAIASTNRSDIFRFGLESSVEALQKTGKKVIIFTDVPELPFFPKMCVSRPLACHLPRAAVDKRQRAFRGIIADITRTHPDVVVFDPTDVFCDEDECFAARGGVVLYSDSHHLSNRGADAVVAKLLTFLNEEVERVTTVRSGG